MLPNNRKNLHCILLKDVKIDIVNEGKFIMVKSICESVKTTSILFIGEDFN